MPGKRIAGSLGALAIAALLLTTVVRLPGLTHQLFDPDEATIATEAIAVNHGGTLYTDATDRKPPLVPMLYAASFKATDSTDLRWPHALASLAIATTGLVLALDMRRRHGNAAAWWALVLTIAGAAAFFPVDGQSANSSHFALLPGAIAVVLAGRGRSSTAFLAGLALGVAVLCRQTWIIGLIGGTVGAMVAGRRRDGAWFAAGTTTVSRARPSTCRSEASGTGRSPATAVSSAKARRSVAPSSTISRASVRSSGSASRSWPRPSSRRSRSPRASRRAQIEQLDLWLWLGGALIAEAAGLRFFGHYWIQALPPLVLLTAPLLAQRNTTRAEVGRHRRRGPDRARGRRHVHTVDVPHVAEPHAAGRLRTHAHAGERTRARMGFVPRGVLEIRPATGRCARFERLRHRAFGGRPTGKGTLSYATPGAYDLMMKRLEECPPTLVLDTSTANICAAPRATPSRTSPRLADFLRSHGYEAVDRVDGVTILKPKDPSIVCSFPG